MTLEEFEKLIEFSEKGLELLKEIGDREAESKSYFNLANAYGRLNNVEKTIEFSEKGLELVKR